MARLTERDAAAAIASAAQANRRGDVQAAIAGYRRAIDHDPSSAMAHNALGNTLLSTGAADAARACFERAAALDPTAPELLLNLAKACRLARDDAAEEAALDAALALDQRHFMARLRAAELHERVGKPAAAALHWGAVLALAPAAAECPPALHPVLDHARAFIAEHMSRFEEAVRPALAAGRAGASAAIGERFDVCVDAALGKRRIYANDCHGLHYPVPAGRRVLRPRPFPLAASIEAQRRRHPRRAARPHSPTAATRSRPMSQQAPGTPRNKWSDARPEHPTGAPSSCGGWRAHRRRVQRLPGDRGGVERLPLADMPGRAPTVFFSLLEPGAHIPAHTGVTNMRTIVHLPLIVPAGCSFRVGGETAAVARGRRVRIRRHDRT